MPPPPPPTMGGGLGPFVAQLADLPAHLSTGWQCVDLMIRFGRTALRSPDMQHADKVIAVLQSQVSVLTKLLAAYTGGAEGSPNAATRADEAPPPAAPDADAQPASASSEEPD